MVGPPDSAEIYSTSSAQFLDLPNELLLLILCQPDISHDALLSLAMLSRRLHYLALPIYFERHGMDDPTETANFAILDGCRDPLSALQISLDVHSINSLSCTFPHYPLSVRSILPHIRRLRALIGRLTFVRKVTLVLDTPNSRNSGTSHGIELWALQFSQLLNTIVKKGCTSLTLRYGVFFDHAYELRSPRLIARPVSAFRNAVRSLTLDSLDPSTTPDDEWEIFQSVGNAAVVQMELDAEGRACSKLTHFRIASCMALIPPGFAWTLSALRHSPVTRLEFVGVSLPTKVWTAVLPRIANLAPTLTELNLSDLYGISGSDILLFLAKLPHLTSLTIGYTEYSRHVQSACADSGPVPKLHHLRSLHAPSTFIAHFLQKPSLPNIESLCITPRRLILGFRGIRLIRQSVSGILRRLEKYKLTPTISLEMHRGRDSEIEMAADLAMLAPRDEQHTTPLRAISRLVIYSDSDMTALELGTLARWIARCFPALHHVSLRTRAAGAVTPPPDDDDPRGVDNARLISAHSPNLKSLELNGKLFAAPASTGPVKPGTPFVEAAPLY